MDDSIRSEDLARAAGDHPREGCTKVGWQSSLRCARREDHPRASWYGGAGRSKYGQAVSNSTSETSHTTTFWHVENRSQSKLLYTHWKFLVVVPTKVERTDGRQVCRPFRLGMCPWGVACASVCFACGKPHAGGKRCRRSRWELASWLAGRAPSVQAAGRA